MGDDHVLDIVGIDIVKLKMNDDTICTIQEVQDVKDRKKNLLSLE